VRKNKNVTRRSLNETNVSLTDAESMHIYFGIHPFVHEN